MAVIFTATHEAGDLSEWTGFTDNFPTVIAGAARAGNYGMRVAMTGNAVRSADFTDEANLYLKCDFRVHITTNPSAQVLMSIVRFEDTTFTGRGALLRLVVNTNGTCVLRLMNTNGMVQVGSDFSVTVDTWYTVELHSMVGNPVTLEMRVDGTVVATNSSLDTGAALMDRLFIATDVSPNGIVGYFDIDDVIVDDAAYPFVAAPPQYARPSADITRVNWEDFAGGTTNIYQSIDETVADDSDGIRTRFSPVNDVYVTKLSTVVDPTVDTGHIIHYHYGKSSASGQQIDQTVQIRVNYMDEVGGGLGTLIRTEVHTNVGAYPIVAAIALTPTEVANILTADYTGQVYARLIGNAP